MTELDFEELDKAVSDLMKDTDSEQVNAPAEATAPAAPAVQNDAGQPVEPSVSAQPAVPAIKNRGRFMDVKPSANPMPPVKPTEQVSHQAPTVEVPKVDETVDTVIEPQSTEQPVEQPPVTATIGDYAADPANVGEHSMPAESTAPSVPVVADEPRGNDTHSSFTMPDPIDMAQAEEQHPDEEKPAEPTPAAEDAAPEQTEEATDAPKIDVEVHPEPAMESPFIPDAKVEKRPLGGIPGEPVEDKTPDGEDKPAETAPLPRELGSDLMNLETDGNDVGVGKDEPKADAPTEQPKVAEPTEEKVAPAAPAAVPASDAKATGGIFDTANYHNMPVAAPVKKKHGWMIVIWILVLLIVGACAGAAYFYFTTQ